MDARLERRGRRRPRADLRAHRPSGEVLAEALVERVLGDGAEIADRFSGARACSAPATSRRSRSSRPRPTARRATPCCPADFVTAEDGTGIVHTAIAFGEDDFRLGAEQGLDVVNPVRLDGTYDERIGPYAGRWVKDADADLIEDLRARGRLLRGRDAAARLPALLALRHAAALLRQAVLVHPHVGDARPAARRQRDASTGTRRTSSTGASASGSRTTSTGRSRASATGARRCRSGAARTAHVEAIGSFAEVEERSGRALPDPHRPVRRRAHVAVRASAAREMRRVPEVIDVWFDSGSMPFAQCHAPFENEELFREHVPGRLHLRGDRPDARLVLLADRDLDAAVRPRALPDRALPRPHRRPAGQEDVEVARQHRRALGGHPPPRRRRVPLVLPDLQAAVGRLPVLDRDGRRVRAPVPAPALEHVRLLRPLRERERDRPAPGAPGDRARPLGDLAAERDDRRGPRADGGLRRDARRPGDRGVRRRALELVRAPLAPALLGRRPGRLRDAARPAWSRSASCSPRSARSSPTRSTRTSTASRAERPPGRLPGGRARATWRSRRRWPSRARRSGSGWRRAVTAS